MPSGLAIVLGIAILRLLPTRITLTSSSTVTKLAERLSVRLALSIGIADRLAMYDCIVTLCWGCELPLEKDVDGDYCPACELGLQLIRKWQDEGLKVYWTIPEQFNTATRRAAA